MLQFESKDDQITSILKKSNVAQTLKLKRRFGSKHGSLGFRFIGETRYPKSFEKERWCGCANDHTNLKINCLSAQCLVEYPGDFYERLDLLAGVIINLTDRDALLHRGALKVRDMEIRRFKKRNASEIHIAEQYQTERCEKLEGEKWDQIIREAETKFFNWICGEDHAAKRRKFCYRREKIRELKLFLLSSHDDDYSLQLDDDKLMIDDSDIETITMEEIIDFDVTEGVFVEDLLNDKNQNVVPKSGDQNLLKMDDLSRIDEYGDDNNNLKLEKYAAIGNKKDSSMEKEKKEEVERGKLTRTNRVHNINVEDGMLYIFENYFLD